MSKKVVGEIGFRKGKGESAGYGRMVMGRLTIS